MSTTLLYCDPFTDFDRLLNGAFTPGYWTASPQPRSTFQTRDVVGILRPRMDLHEDVKNNTVTATFELPGLAKENVQIGAHNGQLNISGEVKGSSEHEESGYTLRERRYGKFARTLQLPQGVTEDQIKASLENGVLTVSFPNTTPEMEPKKITIL